MDLSTFVTTRMKEITRIQDLKVMIVIVDSTSKGRNLAPKEIEDISGVPLRTVSMAITRLMGAGLIVEEGTQRSPKYHTI